MIENPYNNAPPHFLTTEVRYFRNSILILAIPPFSPDNITSTMIAKGVDPLDTRFGQDFDFDWMCVGDSCDSCARSTVAHTNPGRSGEADG